LKNMKMRTKLPNLIRIFL